MPLYKIVVAYDGTNYSGWQVQANSISIQSTLQAAISTILRKATDVTGSGRTDAGVHALGQVAHFESDAALDHSRFLLSVNSLLPVDIRVKSIEAAPDGFHARYNAKSKIYHYHLHLDSVMDPFKRNYRMHIMQKLDLELMRKAAKMLLGTHDFTSFACKAHLGTASRSGVRTLTRLDIVPQEGGVRLEFEADGFLYKMVRNLVGTLLGIGSGRIPLEQLPEIFLAKDRKEAGFTAQPQGLFLMQVNYSELCSSSKKEETTGTLATPSCCSCG